MWDFILASGNLPFSLAFVLVCAIGLLQLLSLLLGLGLSELIDTALPDLDIDNPGFFANGFNWLCLGRLPFLIWLLLWLLLFAVVGWTFQWLLMNLLGGLLPPLPVAIAALAVSLPLQRRLSLLLVKLLPTTETNAVFQRELIGLVGEVVIGEASRERAAEVSVTDKQGHKHYVMAKPYDDLVLSQGQQVLLFDLEDGIYLVSPYPG